MTSKIAQTFILRPDLWKSPDDSQLKLDMPQKSRLFSNADGVALVVGRSIEQAQSRLGILMRRMSG